MAARLPGTAPLGGPPLPCPFISATRLRGTLDADTSAGRAGPLRGKGAEAGALATDREPRHRPEHAQRRPGNCLTRAAGSLPSLWRPGGVDRGPLRLRVEQGAAGAALRRAVLASLDGVRDV